MKTNKNSIIDNYRKIVRTYIDLHLYQAALFWADKVVVLTDSPRDIYWLAQCMFLSKQYHRAAFLLKSNNLEKTYILCNYLTVRCLYEANELNEALKVLNSFNLELSTVNQNETIFFDDTPKNQILSSILLLKGKILEAMDNRTLAADNYKQSLKYNVYNYEAFDCLVHYQMLAANEEQELLLSMPFTEQCNKDETDILRCLYESKLKKYHTQSKIDDNVTKILTSESSMTTKSSAAPELVEGAEGRGGGGGPAAEEEEEEDDDDEEETEGATALPTELLSENRTPISISNLQLTPDIIISPLIISTPVGTNNTQNQQIIDDNLLINNLKNSLYIKVSHAERLYYNCDYEKCFELTEYILKIDPYHDECLPIHISCLVELKNSIKLFSLAHHLVDLYPNLPISWFAVGCYYFIIGKNDFARRYLAKATCLNRLFGPAWLAYGHSFAIENEHDQAMAAYFKASQLMNGCHLPLLYIGLECGLTNNVRLAEKFFKQAQTIAPDDPFVLHEMGVIAFQNLNFKAAEKHFKDALTIVTSVRPGLIPQNWEALLNNLGHTCRKLKKYDESLEYHFQALSLVPQSVSTYAAIAYDYSLMMKTEDAVEWFHKALSLRNDDSFCTTMLNYVVQQLSESKPPYPGAPDEIPKFDLQSKSVIEDTNIENTTQQTITSGTMEISDVNMSIEVDMSDESVVK